MKGNNFQLKSWSWLVFPAVAGVIILLGSNFVLFGQDRWLTLFEEKGKIEAEEQKIRQLKLRLELIKSMNEASELEREAKLARAVPGRREVWKVITEIGNAASESGVQVKDYRLTTTPSNSAEEASDSAREELNDSFNVLVVLNDPDLGELNSFLTSLENKTPLVEVEKVKYGNDQAEINVKSVWKGEYEILDSGDLFGYDRAVSTALGKVAGFADTADAELEIPGGDNAEVNVNPF